MYKQSDAALTAWRATERTLDGKVTITDSSGNETDYGTSDITSIAYDSGAWTGDTFSIGSTYENNITVTFAHLVEGLEQGYKVTAKIGIKLPDGTYEYCPLGVFIISDEITMDRNNDATTIKAYDQFCVMQGTYTSKLTYPAKVTDVIAEIANMSGVELNTDDIAELPTQTDLASAISGQTYCTAIGWIAQFYGGFALFDRDGKLTIRTVTDASYILDASQYEQSGLTKNEATYQIGGMSVSVTTTTTDSTGESSETTSTLTAGETTGSQIELTNNVMTQARLDSIWSTIKDITFYPYSLTWFGNPAIEAGDWLTLKDTAGNSFNVPNNSYTMTFDGGLTATSKADQTSTSSSSYSYSGTLSQTVKQLAGRQGATGNYIFGTDVVVEPTTAKIGDQWYKQNGNKIDLWQYVRQSDGTGKWELMVSDLTGEEIKANVDKAMVETDTATRNANAAVETGNQALTKAQTAIDTANTAADNASTANANASTALNNAANAIQQAQSAANDATSATNIANAVKQDVTTLKDGSTMTIAELESGLALKITKDDMNTALQPYATQSWTSTKISATADEINSSIASVKKTADGNATDVTSLKQRADGFDTSISNLTSTKADQTWTTNQIKASADSLNVNIAKVQTQVNDSAVGTNLLTGTTDFDPENWDYFDPSILSFSNEHLIFQSAKIGSGSYSDLTHSLTQVQPNTTYTLSWSLIFQSGPLSLYAVEYKDENNVTASYQDHSLSLGGNYNTLARKNMTFTTQSDCKYIKLIVRCFSGGTYSAININFKLELGTNATDYSANPADNATVTSVTAISATVNGLATTVSGKVDNSTYTSKMTQLDNAISTKVESSDYNSKMTQLDNAIQTKVNSSDYNTEVTQLNNMINSKVTANGDITNICLNPYFDDGLTGWNGIGLVSNGNGDSPTKNYGGQSQRDAYYGNWFNVAEGDVFFVQGFAWQDTPSYDFYVGLSFKDTSGTNEELWYGVIKFSAGTTSAQSSTETGNIKVPSGYDQAIIWTQIATFSNFGRWWFTNIYVGRTAPAGEMYSRIQQLSDNINLRVVKNDVINQINVSTESILIAGNKVHITGSTTIDNAVIKSAMIDSISADKITAGTLNAANVNVINLNANNISSGTLTGVSFHQSSSGHDTWIDGNGVHDYDGSGNNAWIQKGTLQVYDQNGAGVFMNKGTLNLSTYTAFSSSQSNVYGTISSSSNVFGSGYNGINISSTKAFLIKTGSYDDSSFIFRPSSQLQGTGVGSNGTDLVLGAEGWATLYGGTPASVSTSKTLPYITVGTNNSALPDPGNGIRCLTGTDGLYIETYGGNISISNDGTGHNAILLMSSGGDTYLTSDADIKLNAFKGSKSGEGTVFVYGNFDVLGSKNAIVQTSVGWAKINAYETAEYYFGDIGETETGSGNSVEITMDSLFLETVNTSVGYQVFITPYSNAKIWVDERNSDNFVVKSDTPSAKFAYEIKAKRKGYENTRLEIDKDFGKEAA